MGFDLLDMAKGITTGLNPVQGIIEEAAQAVGIPKEVVNAGEIAVGIATGNPIMAFSGAAGLAGNMLDNAAANTEMPPSSSSYHPATGYAQSGGSSNGYGVSASDCESAPGVMDTRHPDVMNFFADALHALGNMNYEMSSKVLGGLLGNHKGGVDALLQMDHQNYDNLVDTLLSHKNVRQSFENKFGCQIDDSKPRPPAGIGYTTTPPSVDESSSIDDASADEPSASTATSSATHTSHTKHDKVGDILNDPHMTLEQKVEALLNALQEDIDGDIVKTMSDLEKAQKNDGSLDKAGQKKNETTIAELTQRLQTLMQRRQEMVTLESNMSKSFHDQAMCAISNLK